MNLVYDGEFFHEFTTTCPDAAKLNAALEAKGILGGLELSSGNILWCCTEQNSKEEIDEVIATVKEVF